MIHFIFSGNLDPVIQNFEAIPGPASSPSPKSSDFKIVTKYPAHFTGMSSQAIGENLDRLTKQFEQFHRLQRNAENTYHSGSSDQQFLLSSMNSQKTSHSSMSGANDNWSQFTSQTSLSSFSSVYSRNYIYQLDSTQRLELNKDFPIGQGQFGIVYKGVLSR